MKTANSGASVNTRKGVIEFDFQDPIVVKDASLMLDLSGLSNGTSGTFYVWGIDDSSALEHFNEATAHYNTFSSIFETSIDGINNNSNHLYGNAMLGQFSVTTSDVGKTISFSSSALIDFINEDTDGVVTVILTRGSNNSTNTAFASRQHATLNPPRLLGSS